MGKRKSQLLFDEELLGARLPGSPSERMRLLHTLLELVDEYGEEWVRSNRERLLDEAQFIVENPGP